MTRITFKRLALLTISILSLSLEAKAFETKAKNAILMDYETGAYLFTKNHQEMIAPASMSKLMTIYVLLNKIKEGEVSLEDTFIVSEKAWRKGGAASGGSTMFLNINQEVTVEDLIKGVIIQSGNDACITIAENISGSEEEFATIMNETAEKIGLKNAHFMNATGLPHPEHRISVEDLAILAYHIIKEFPEYYDVFKQKEFKFNGIKQGNRNPLLYSLKGADGLKTGHTDEAGFCLTGSVQRGDRRLIEVVAGLKSNKERAEETENLITWGFANYHNYTFFKKNQIVADIPVWYGVKESVQAITPEVKKTLKNNDKNKYSAKLVYSAPIKAPIKAGDTIGSIELYRKDKLSDTIPLYAKEDIAEISKLNRFWINLKYLLLGNKQPEE